MTSDLPIDIRTDETRYELEDPLEKLQAMLNKNNIDIESLDMRGTGQDIMFRGVEPKELQVIMGYVDGNPKQEIRSKHVKDLNDMFDKNLINADPNYIFRDDIITRNNISTIQRSNQTYARDRDLYIVPPPKDTQQKIFELLKK